MFAKHFSRRPALNITLEDAESEMNLAATTTVEAPATTSAQEPAATEPAATPAAAAAATPAEAGEAAEAVDMGEEEFEAVENGFDDIEVETDNINTAADQSDTLGAIADRLEEQEANGGATPETMEIVEVAVEHCVATLQGFRPRRRLTPSLESFGGTKSRVRATQVTVDGIREWASEAAKQIAAMAERIIQWLKGILASLQTGTSKLRARLAKLREKFKSGKPADKAEATVSIPKRIADSLRIGGQFSKELFFKGLERSHNFITKVLAYLGITRKTVEDTVQKVDETGEDEPKVDVSQMAQAVKGFGGTREEKGEGVVTVTELEILPGDVNAEITGPSGEVIDGVTYRVVSSADVKLSTVSQEADVEDVEIKNFTPNEVDQAMNKVEELIDLADQASEATKETVGMETKLLNMVKSKLQRFKDGASAAARNFKNFVSRATGGIARPVGVVVRFLRNVISAALWTIGQVMAALGYKLGDAEMKASMNKVMAETGATAAAAA